MKYLALIEVDNFYLNVQSNFPQMLSQLNRQLAERQNADTQESTYLDLTVNTSDAAAAAANAAANVTAANSSENSSGGGGETVSLIFPDADRRTQWEDAFSQVKRRLGEYLQV